MPQPRTQSTSVAARVKEFTLPSIRESSAHRTWMAGTWLQMIACLPIYRETWHVQQVIKSLFAVESLLATCTIGYT